MIYDFEKFEDAQYKSDYKKRFSAQKLTQRFEPKFESCMTMISMGVDCE